MKSNTPSRFKQLPRDSLLAQFLSRHDDSHNRGFITRIDRSPLAAKRLAFTKALALNVFILLFVAGFASVTIIRDVLSPLPAHFRLAICITQNLIIISSIIILVRSTTIPFFFGECRLRIFYGFQTSEIVIRKPPTMSLKLNNSNTTEDQRMEKYWRIATRAVNPELLYSNASAMLSSEYWTVEYRAVFDALSRIAAGEFQEEDLEFAIWKQDSKIWNACELWRMHEIMNDQQEVAMFKTFLTQSGKQELLTIWEEMLSCTSSSGEVIERSPSPKAYQVMVDKFAREGLDYEAVWCHVSEKTSLISA
ncbi:hypothetical protein M413DRAFT_366511 [Hebeloma cylindrosporum]|uniref:Uncharacterized protein n=1 Tax=Hebeloma cylindrosporum TaxID=76867 RepID=A0A0C3C7U1_HEBCY|nr:hypothetical protein M413DRAFT_366511 [Hebeloma cylindrosporum h7]